MIAKKIRKEVEAFVEQVGFTKEQIAATRAKHTTEQGEASSVPTDKTRVAKAKATEKKMEEEITKKLNE